MTTDDALQQLLLNPEGPWPNEVCEALEQIELPPARIIDNDYIERLVQERLDEQRENHRDNQRG